ncbi:tRNA preQ1(34) S-adenosylmethionine ribosyltransferase-isomerase QueA [Candidatus Atelocyanobacterium thalassae]|uniref:S-adenosylmethionine:tRNA ribosyltransferase-isomerase n=2 Tax=Candidatus Atelocyanobacterium thalassae TaxID=713887 RepID=A0A086CII6_9CHRO|nr:tRNA preQ1(34) S-adenosylmethionine ribosyltransferase-isomerase QueA [Candidatus Atelocyanobacterium thalassa]KFF42000.1 MAG: S-adenosylmethionine--tRNA ribosyltransferase-isomerase [Candidatus Atelocyanobacterium thalassa isolate SIO64986]BDA39818.1 S-adenosylmethionine:tRNA ribosyltransferase-isomerase [cyanobacterium endosymbiont of Braarudosphaera bigelowii]
MNDDYSLSNYNYHLPSELIAQNPLVPRDSSRLLVVNSSNTHVHSFFNELPKWLLPGDLLVFNDTRVVPARLYGQKTTGAKVEVLLLEEKEPFTWIVLVKPGKRFKIGSKILFTAVLDEFKQDYLLEATVIDHDEKTGGRVLKFNVSSKSEFWEALERIGHLPLPPYLTNSSANPSQYQTIYAQKPGAVAAPTAGLHFTQELLQNLQKKGINQAYVTLHVGLGTFRPVNTDNIKEHTMHQEWIEVSNQTIQKINKTKSSGGRVIAVGTTVVRALEGMADVTSIDNKYDIKSFSGKTNIFIYPGYKWHLVDGMITNFHLPKSSLLMLVSALIGRDRLLELYKIAIEEKYRFYSFGDGMLVLLS